jgi:hypothetical protein
MRRSIRCSRRRSPSRCSCPLRRAATWELDHLDDRLRDSPHDDQHGARPVPHVHGKATGDPKRPTRARSGLDRRRDIDTRRSATGTSSRPIFDVAKFPTITFKSKTIAAAGAGKAKVTGDLRCTA